MLFELYYMRWVDVPLPAFLTTRSNHFVECDLCQTGGMTCRDSVHQHLAGRNHSNKLLHLERLQRKLKAKGSRSENVGVAKNLQARIESLGLTRWRWEVQALLLEGDQNDKPGIAAEALLNEVPRFEYWRNLNKKELME